MLFAAWIYPSLSVEVMPLPLILWSKPNYTLAKESTSKDVAKIISSWCRMDLLKNIGVSKKQSFAVRNRAAEKRKIPEHRKNHVLSALNKNGRTLRHKWNISHMATVMQHTTSLPTPHLVKPDLNIQATIEQPLSPQTLARLLEVSFTFM